jgi:hypothetical protein
MGATEPARRGDAVRSLARRSGALYISADD